MEYEADSIEVVSLERGVVNYLLRKCIIQRHRIRVNAGSRPACMYSQLHRGNYYLVLCAIFNRVSFSVGRFTNWAGWPVVWCFVVEEGGKGVGI